LPADELQALGFAVAIHPAAGFLSAAAALQTAYADLKANGINTDRTELYSFAEFNQLIGFEDVWAFDQRYAV